MSSPNPFAPYRGGSTEPWIADILAAIVKAKVPTLIVETGTFRALTTRALYDALGESGAPSTLITIDLSHERAAAAVEMVAQWPTYPDVAVSVREGDALAHLAEMPSESADFVFLDDDHHAPHVRQEIAESLRILRWGGICCVHDVVGPFGLGDVVKEFGGVVLDLPRLHVAGGLGIIAK